jgi:hypothetical protein
MKRHARLVLLTLFALGCWSLTPPASLTAQPLKTRFGLGFNMLLSAQDGLGVGFRGRASAPINSDLSFAADLGFSGFVFQGRDDASYIFDPQVSAIVTLPGIRSAPYFLGGLGAYIPLTDADGKIYGPTVHMGIGWVRPLNETTLFYEINPALIIGESKSTVALPFRIGIIF